VTCLLRNCHLDLRCEDCRKSQFIEADTQSQIQYRCLVLISITQTPHLLTGPCTYPHSTRTAETKYLSLIRHYTISKQKGICLPMKFCRLSENYFWFRIGKHNGMPQTKTHKTSVCLRRLCHEFSFREFQSTWTLLILGPQN
jgi:hypothetical protein